MRGRAHKPAARMRPAAEGSREGASTPVRPLDPRLFDRPYIIVCYRLCRRSRAICSQGTEIRRNGLRSSASCRRVAREAHGRTTASERGGSRFCKRGSSMLFRANGRFARMAIRRRARPTGSGPEHPRHPPLKRIEAPAMPKPRPSMALSLHATRTACRKRSGRPSRAV